MKKLIIKILYKILKNDMIEKLSDKHGEQFIDDVMETFGIPTTLLKDALNNKNNSEFVINN
jgi:hypothetical protein